MSGWVKVGNIKGPPGTSATGLGVADLARTLKDQQARITQLEQRLAALEGDRDR